MKAEKWIGSKYYGYLDREDLNKDGQKFNGLYFLQIWTWNNGTVYLDSKFYKYKQSAIRYIKNNF
jgi:hypothetical protein